MQNGETISLHSLRSNNGQVHLLVSLSIHVYSIHVVAIDTNESSTPHTLLAFPCFALTGLQLAGIEGIESHIVRPFFLHPGVQLLDVLAVDPFQRFVIMGFGADARVTIRTFRGDEPEIEKYVEQWRKLITEYLLSKNDVLGASHLPIGLSKIGAYVARPIGTYAFLRIPLMISAQVT